MRGISDEKEDPSRERGAESLGELPHRWEDLWERYHIAGSATLSLGELPYRWESYLIAGRATLSLGELINRSECHHIAGSATTSRMTWELG